MNVFNLKKLYDVEVKRQHHIIRSSNRRAALENLVQKVTINRT
jgi:hypothetical protein